MKLKLKIAGMVLMLIGLCSPAFSTDYAAEFRQFAKGAEPKNASVEQMREFYNRYKNNYEKAEVMQQMAAWKGIAPYKTFQGFPGQLPNIKFLDFALTIENQLEKEDDCVLSAIYRNTNIVLRASGKDISAKQNNEDFAKQTQARDKAFATFDREMNEMLGNKTIQIREFKVRSSWVARGALFEAALQGSEEFLYDWPANWTDLVFIGDILSKFSVKSQLFGVNNAQRKQLMKDALDFIGGRVFLYVYLSTSDHSKDSQVVKALDNLENAIKTAGGEGLKPVLATAIKRLQRENLQKKSSAQATQLQRMVREELKK